MRIHATEGTLKHSVLQIAKRIAYRVPALSRPRYEYNVEPSQLAFLVNAIDQTKHLNGCIVEIGVARGMTTVFLNEHLSATNDPRRYLCIDTFSGFTDDDIAFEVSSRGKPRNVFGGFTYLDRDIFAANMAVYERVQVVQKDCGLLTNEDLGSVSVAFLDVDLYQPTLKALNTLHHVVQQGGLVLVDDIKPSGIYDGAYAAMNDFCSRHGLSYDRIGNKGGAIHY